MAVTRVRCRRPHRAILRKCRLGIGRNRLVGHPSIEIVGQGLGRGVAVLGLFGHGLQADGFQCFVEPGITLGRPWELPLLHGPQDNPDVFTLERRLAGQKAVERCAQTVNVGPRAQPVEVATGLFGAHVGRRPEG